MAQLGGPPASPRLGTPPLMMPTLTKEEMCPLLQAVIGEAEPRSLLNAERMLGQQGDDGAIYNYVRALDHQARRLRDVVQMQMRMVAAPALAAEALCSSAEQLFEGSSVTVHAVMHHSMRLLPTLSSDPSRLDEGENAPSADEGILRALLPRGAAPVRATCGGKSILAHAVSSEDGETIGIVEVLAAHERGFTADDSARLSLLAPHCRSALLAHREQLSKRRTTPPPMEQLLELVGGMTQQLEVAPLLRHIRMACKEVMGAEMCTVFIVDRQRQLLTAHTSEEEGAQPFTVPMHVGIVGYVAQTGERVNLGDAYHDARFDPSMDRKTSKRTKALLCLPIYDKHGTIIGVAEGINKRHGSGRFEKEDETVMAALCNVFAVCLLNAAVFEAEKTLRMQKEALLELTLALTSKLELHSLVRAIRSAACSIMDAERCTVFIRQPDSEQLLFKLSEAEGGRLLSLPVGQGVAGHCAQSGETINLVDAYADARFDKSVDLRTGQHTKTLLCMPLRQVDRLTGHQLRGGRLVGVVQLINKRGGGAFTSDDEKLFGAVCSHLSGAICNAMLYRDVVASSRTLEALLASSRDVALTISRDGALLRTNQPLGRLFPAAADAAAAAADADAADADAADAATDAADAAAPTATGTGLSWLTAGTAAGGAELAADVSRLLLQGGGGGGGGSGSAAAASVSREGVLVGPADAPLAVSYRVTPLYAPRGGLTELGSPTKGAASSQASPGTSASYDEAAAGDGDELLGVLVVLRDDTPPPPLPPQPQQQLQQVQQPQRVSGSMAVSDADALADRFERWSAQLDPVLEAAAGGGVRGAVGLPPPSLAPLDELRLPGGCSLLEWRGDFREQPMGPPELLLLTVRMLSVVGPAEGFGVSHEALVRFAAELHDAYLPNPFHSYRHGLMVLHKTFLLAAKTSLCTHLSRLDLFALMLAAVGHDVGHLGRSNAYEMAAESPLALLYNNRSVLESHHCATLFKLVTQRGLLSGLSRPQRSYVRQLVIDSITATDMALHHDLVATLQALPSQLPAMDAARGAPPPADAKEAKAWAASLTCRRSKLLQCVLHAADLCTPTLPFSASVGWVRALGREFASQVELERERGLPESTFLVPSDFAGVGRMELGFAGHVVGPFWKHLAGVLPEAQSQCEMLDSNLELWKAVAAGTPLDAIDATAQHAIVAEWARLPVLLSPAEMPRLPPEMADEAPARPSPPVSTGERRTSGGETAKASRGDTLHARFEVL